jgi:heme o synthase
VTGRFQGGFAWYAGIALVTLFSCLAAALATNLAAAIYIFLGAFTYGVVYTVWLKRRTWLNIVIGGLQPAALPSWPVPPPSMPNSSPRR